MPYIQQWMTSGYLIVEQQYEILFSYLVYLIS